MKTFTRLSHSLRNNIVILFTTVGLIVAIGAILYYLETTFQNEKNSFIVSQPKRFFSDIRQTHATQLNELALQVLTKGTPQNYMELKHLFERIVDNPDSIIYGMELFTSTNASKLSYENRDKYRLMNNHTNSLVSRRFSHLIQIGIAVGETEYGRLVGYYTSPQNIPEIEQLTRRYLSYAILIPLCLIGIYGLSLKWFLFPVRRVVDHLANTEFGVVEVIPSPHTLIENVYNRMAWNTKMLTVNLSIADLVASQPNLTIEETIFQICRTVEQQMGYNQVTVCIWDPDIQQIEFYHPKEKTNSREKIRIDSRLTNEFQQSMNQGLPRIIHRNANLASAKHAEGNKHTDQDLHAYFQTDTIMICPLSSKETIKELLLVSNPISHNNFLEKDKDAIHHIAQQVNLALQKKEFQRRLIEQEKNQVSINLARNFGHDLTNVIAATRWDLNTLQSLLTKLNNTTFSVNQQELIEQAINGLTHSAEFLQEIVDIYRAFSYLKKPVFEDIDINNLLTKIIELFQLSTAGKVLFKTEFAPDMPRLEIEPRLMKLAIFNLLTNALEAIKTASVSRSIEGVITIKTYWLEKNKRFNICISDNGWGIRDAQGNLIPEEQTRRLFDHGYSTKEKEAAGGLGLSWVQTIISEFHSGKISAKNNPDDGACFTIELNLKQPDIQ